MLQEYPDRSIILENCIPVDLPPYFSAFEIWGVCFNDNEVWLMDSVGYWHGPLREEQMNAPLVISEIYKRLKSLLLEHV